VAGFDTTLTDGPCSGQDRYLRELSTYIPRMNSLDTELRRLYLVDGDPASLTSTDDHVRALVLELARPADWQALSTVWQGVQSDLGLPAPAIAVNGNDGFQLWFSLAEPVTTGEASFFLESLRHRYLNTISPERISMLPTETRHALLVPALQQSTGQWSAFVAPDLAAIFIDSPGLDVCPSVDSQAKVLAPLKSIKASVFEALLDQVISDVESRSVAKQTSASATPASTTQSNTDAKRFLNDVMNDTFVEMHLRIEAAKALLPYS
jgi:hypothetical protein